MIAPYQGLSSARFQLYVRHLSYIHTTILPYNNPTHFANYD